MDDRDEHDGRARGAPPGERQRWAARSGRPVGAPGPEYGGAGAGRPAPRPGGPGGRRRRGALPGRGVDEALAGGGAARDRPATGHDAVAAGFATSPGQPRVSGSGDVVGRAPRPRRRGPARAPTAAAASGQGAGGGDTLPRSARRGRAGVPARALAPARGAAPASPVVASPGPPDGGAGRAPGSPGWHAWHAACLIGPRAAGIRRPRTVEEVRDGAGGAVGRRGRPGAHGLRPVDAVRGVPPLHGGGRGGGAVGRPAPPLAGDRRRRTEEWTAEITDQTPDTRVAWKSTSGAENAGAVTFQPLSDAQTRVRLILTYEPEGVVEHVGDALGVVARRVEGDLKRFKEFIESRETETGAWRGEIHGAHVREDDRGRRCARRAATADGTSRPGLRPERVPLPAAAPLERAEQGPPAGPAAVPAFWSAGSCCGCP